MTRYFCALIVFVLLFRCAAPVKTARISSGKEAGMVELVICPTVSGKPLYIDSTYTNPKGESYSLSSLRFFIGRIACGKAVGEEQPALAETASGVYLMDFNHPDYDAGYGFQSCRIRFRMKEGNYTDLRFDMGVPRSFNHRDPSTAVYPLDMGRGEMYWNWNSGYIFFLAEGKGTGVYKDRFHFAIGSDQRIMPFSFGNLFEVVPLIQVQKNKTTIIRLELDFNALMKNGDQSLYSLGTAESAIVHGGCQADQLRQNLLNSLQFHSVSYK